MNSTLKYMIRITEGYRHEVYAGWYVHMTYWEGWHLDKAPRFYSIDELIWVLFSLNSGIKNVWFWNQMKVEAIYDQ
jgi:hypothetical protein